MMVKALIMEYVQEQKHHLISWVMFTYQDCRILYLDMHGATRVYQQKSVGMREATSTLESNPHLESYIMGNTH